MPARGDPFLTDFEQFSFFPRSLNFLFWPKSSFFAHIAIPEAFWGYFTMPLVHPQWFITSSYKVNIDPSFAYVGRSDDVTDIHCDFRGRGLGVRCLLGNPYASNRTDSLLFRVVPSQSSPFVQKTASFSVVANTSSEDIGETSDRTHEFQVSGSIDYLVFMM